MLVFTDKSINYFITYETLHQFDVIVVVHIVLWDFLRDESDLLRCYFNPMHVEDLLNFLAVDIPFLALYLVYDREALEEHVTFVHFLNRFTDRRARLIAFHALII